MSGAATRPGHASMPSLRESCAQILDALSLDVTRPFPYAIRLSEGAKTLRWCDEAEATPTGDEVGELEALREFLGEVEGILGQATGPRGGKAHPGTTLKMIADAVAAVTS